MGGIESSLVWLILMAVLWLVFLEGLLSADNALVLAMMVRHLPRDEQKRALYYGLIGALVFRVIAVLTAKFLLEFWFLQVAGGGYLLYLAAAHFLGRDGAVDEDGVKARVRSGFWATVLAVELADIAFSIDSILAAVAMANGLPLSPTGQFWIVIIGGFLGIITMRYVASYFILLLERFRGLETAAYGLVAWIGLKLVVDGLHHGHYVGGEMNPWVFWIGMAAIVVMGFVYRPKGLHTPHDTLELAQEVSRSFSNEFEAPDAVSRGMPGVGVKNGSFPETSGDATPNGDGAHASDAEGGVGCSDHPSAGLPSRPGSA